MVWSYSRGKRFGEWLIGEEWWQQHGFLVGTEEDDINMSLLNMKHEFDYGEMKKELGNAS